MPTLLSMNLRIRVLAAVATPRPRCRTSPPGWRGSCFCEPQSARTGGLRPSVAPRLALLAFKRPPPAHVGCHKRQKVRERIQWAGASLHCRPPYCRISIRSRTPSQAQSPARQKAAMRPAGGRSHSCPARHSSLPRSGLLFGTTRRLKLRPFPALVQALAAQHQAQVARRTTDKERIANSLRRDIEVGVMIVTGQAPVLGAVNDRALRLGPGELGTHALTGSPELIAHAIADLVGTVSAPSGNIISHGSLFDAKRSSGRSWEHN
jgi:hypothetical protein